MEVFYRDDQLQAIPNWTMNMLTADVDRASQSNKAFGAEDDETENEVKCVGLYIEVEHDIFTHHETFEATQAWIEAVYAQVFVLFDNDGLTLTLQTVFIWDTPDSYTYDKLNEFRDRLNGDYDGDLAQLVSYEGGGGVAYVDVLCEKFWGLSYSGLDRTYNDVPTYSWTIGVIAHELGHNLGSLHTHDCVWGDGDDAIDCCGAQAGYDTCGGSCNADPYLPVNGGTILSYCHLIWDVGINFNEGFGSEVVARMNVSLNAA